MANDFQKFEEFLSQTVDRTTITKDDVMRLLEASLEKGEPFATEFNDRVISPLARKLENRMNVSPVTVDGEGLGKHITNSLKAATEDPTKETSIKIRKQFDSFTSAISDQIKKASKQELDIPTFFPVSKKRQDTVVIEWSNLQDQLLQSVSKSVQRIEYDLKESKPDIFIPKDLLDRYHPKWKRLQDDIFSNIQESARTIDLSDDSFSMKSLLFNEGKTSPEMKRKWTRTQSRMMESLLNQVKSTDSVQLPSFKSSDKKTLLEEEPTVKVSDFTREALKDLKNIIPNLDELKIQIEEKTQEGRLPSWMQKLSGLAATLGAGLLGAGALGLMEEGPLKGTMKIATKAGSKVIGMMRKTITNVITRFLKTIAKPIPKFIKSMFGQASSPITKMLSKGGGKGIMKKMLGPVSKIFTKGFLKRIPIVGLIISAGYAYSRFKSGDIIGGMVDILSGLVSTVPIVGTAASIGLDIFNAWLDTKAGGANEKVTAKKYDIMKKMVLPKVSSLLKTGLRYVPVIGSFIRAGEAIEFIKQGKIFEGIAQIAGSVMSILPGPGSLIAAGLDIFSHRESISEKSGVLGEKTFDIWYKIKQWAGEQMSKLGIFKAARGFMSIISGSIKPGLISFARGIADVPLIGKPFNMLVNWITGTSEETKADTMSNIPKFNLMDTIKEDLKKKAIKMFQGAPDWMRFLMKRMPGMSGILKSEPDVEMDVKYKENQGKIEDIKAKILKKEERIERSKKEKVYAFDQKKGREREAELIEKLQQDLAVLIGENRTAPLNDFIWRPGSKAQPFNSEDNILSIKDDNAFDNIIKILKGQFEEKKASFDDSQDKIEQQTLRKELKELFSLIQELLIENRKGPGVGTLSDTNGLIPNDDSQGDIRDPAYMLRAKVWNYVRTGSVLL